MSVPDQLNLFTGGQFDEGNIVDATLACFTDGWFDVGFVAIVERAEFDVQIGGYSLHQTQIGGYSLHPVQIGGLAEFKVEI